MFTRDAMKDSARHAIGAWSCALALAVCALAATPAGGQTSAPRFDPDAMEQRLRGLNEQLATGGFERPAGIGAAERSGGSPEVDPGRLILRPGFLRGHLLPRMTRQLGDITSIHALETQRSRFEDSGMHDWVSGEVAYRARRATRKAAKAYLIEETRIGSWVESLHVSRGGTAAARATDYGLDVSHGIPKVGMRHRAAVGTTRFEVGVDGSVRFEFRPARSTTARFYAGYEAELSGYRLSYRVDF